MAAGEEDAKEAKPAAAESITSPKSSGSGSSTEFEPPLACVRRMLKNTLPSNTNVGKDACSAFSRACGIFIIYLTACANDFARESKRQTITANDILAAVKELDFEEFSPQLTAFIEEHRKAEKKKKALKKSEEEAKANAKHDRDDDQSQDDGESSNKRQKIEEEKIVSDTPEEIMTREGNDDVEESLADASQDDGDSQTNMEEDDDEKSQDE